MTTNERDELINNLKKEAQYWVSCIGRDNHTEERINWGKIADFVMQDRERIVEDIELAINFIEDGGRNQAIKILTGLCGDK